MGVIATGNLPYNRSLRDPSGRPFLWTNINWGFKGYLGVL